MENTIINVNSTEKKEFTLVADLPLAWQTSAELELEGNCGDIAPTQEDVVRMIARALRIGKNAPNGRDNVIRRLEEEKNAAKTEAQIPDEVNRLKIGIRMDFIGKHGTPYQLYDGMEVEDDLRLTMENIVRYTDDWLSDVDATFVIFISGDSAEQLKQYRELLIETDYGYETEEIYLSRGWRMCGLFNADLSTAMKEFPTMCR